MIYLAALLILALLIGLTFALFIVSQNVPAELHGSAKALLLPWLYLGLGLDIAMNVLIASVVFLELPKELTISERVRRHEHESAGYRYLLAVWICEGWLRPTDPGHC